MPERRRRSERSTPENTPRVRRTDPSSDRTSPDQQSKIRNLQEDEVSKLSTLSNEERIAAVLDLQNRYGNRRVQRMLARLADVSRQEEPESDPNAVSTEIAQRIDGQQGSGQPLESNAQGEMEAAFGQDFSNVRVHTGSESEALNKDVQAKAFTTGQDIFFGSGNYAPGSADGKELLAHELTHVVQQGSAPAASAGPSRVTSPDDASEVEAAKVAESVMQQGQVAREGEEEEEVMMAREGEEEEVMMARQGEEIAQTAQKLGYKIGSKGSKIILEGAFEGRIFDVSAITVVNAAQMQKEWDDRYSVGSYDGSNGQAEGPDGPLEGFEDPDTHDIFINKDDQAVDTVPHELLHRHENGAVVAVMGANANEGVTEYLTQKAVSGFGFTPSSSYPQELKIAQKLANLVGDTAVETAYFDGDVGAIKESVDGAKGLGVFDEIVDAMMNDDYGRAKNTLDTGVPVPAPVPAAP